MAVVKINRPEARNAVNGDVAQGIEAAIDRLEDDDDLWVGVVTGEPPVFCAGADLKAINAGNAGRAADRAGRLRRHRHPGAHQADHRRRRRARRSPAACEIVLVVRPRGRLDHRHASASPR